MEQALLDELTTSRETVSTLTEVLFRMEAQLSSRLEHVERSQSATEVLVTYFGRRVIENEGELTSAVAHVGSLCEALTTAMAHDRDDRRSLLEAMTTAVEPAHARVTARADAIDLTGPSDASASVVGGTFFAGPPPTGDDANNDDHESGRGWRKWAKR